MAMTPKLVAAALAVSLLPSCAYRWVKEDDGQHLDERLAMVSTRLEARACDDPAPGTVVLLDAPFVLAVANLGANDRVLYRMVRPGPDGRPQEIDPTRYAIAWNGATDPSDADRARQEQQRTLGDPAPDADTRFEMSTTSLTCARAHQHVADSARLPARPRSTTAPPPLAPVEQAAPNVAGQTVRAKIADDERAVAAKLGIEPAQVQTLAAVYNIAPEALRRFRPLDLRGLTGPGLYPLTLITDPDQIELGREYVIEFLAVQQENPDARVVNEPYRSTVRLRPIRNSNYLGALIGTGFVFVVFLTGLAL